MEKNIVNSKNNESVMNVVENNETVYQCLDMNGAIKDVPVEEEKGERVGFFKSEQGFHGSIAVNEPHGWRLDRTIYFDFAHNAYIKSRMSLEKLVDITAESIGIKEDDTSLWAKDLRTLIGGFIEHFDKYLDEDDDFDDEDPSELNDSMTGVLFDGIVLHCDIYDFAGKMKPHTEEEKQAMDAEDDKFFSKVRARIAKLEKTA